MMDSLQYFLAMAIVILMPTAGLIVSWLTKEEVAVGRRYFLIAEKVAVTISVFAVTSVYIQNYYMNIGIAFLSLAALFLIAPKLDDNIFNLIMYGAFGVLFFLSSKDQEAFFVSSAMMIIFSLACASMIGASMMKQRKSRLEMVLRGIITALPFAALATLLRIVF